MKSASGNREFPWCTLNLQENFQIAFKVIPDYKVKQSTADRCNSRGQHLTPARCEAPTKARASALGSGAPDIEYKMYLVFGDRWKIQTHRGVIGNLAMTSHRPTLPTLIEHLARRLQTHQPRRLEVEHFGRAAVLMLVLRQGQDFCFLLTRRTDKVETHKGQISFPGGIREQSDQDLLQTALRETWEEIGLSQQVIHVLGEFDEYLSITGLIVTPFAAYVDGPLNLVPNPDEVDEILRVPFSLFQDPRTLRIETRKRQGVARKIYFYDFHGKEIWGLTAQMIRDFLRFAEAE